MQLHECNIDKYTSMFAALTVDLKFIDSSFSIYKFYKLVRIGLFYFL